MADVSVSKPNLDSLRPMGITRPSHAQPFQFRLVCLEGKKPHTQSLTHIHTLTHTYTHTHTHTLTHTHTHTHTHRSVAWVCRPRPSFWSHSLLFFSLFLHPSSVSFFSSPSSYFPL